MFSFKLFKKDHPAISGKIFMKKLKLLLITFLATLWGSQASALSLENYNQLKSEDPAQLIYYLTGVRDGVSWSNLFTSSQIYCLPKNSTLETNQIIKIIDATAKTTNTNADSQVEMLLLFGLKALYPCQ